ncbi:GNAT family N-acetyltransferase [Celeribacter indicus]|uniref:L-ornithine N(alpha)-acyltransferase n=1 Tax=Celeribacter indicus TaxID=1208324 RepID=A0A0B5DVI1_9RHOB|nr:GNAT family N-acyltransferase [Celeribacter indicus]AJE47029.1 phospholipid/glycerol acyltransferase [Celeribacter indicus]SDW92568.1 ornithine-acyl[acyl carrier protein] N-acyltransferase [Celeribacter indicus]
MSLEQPRFRLKFAETEAELRAAQRLRYRVFVEELGSDGEMVDHAAQLEADRFDPAYRHLMLVDPARSADPLDTCVAVYRLLSQDKAEALGGFYSEGEYDLTPLKRSGKRLLELGRSCVAKDYRGGPALFQMWAGLARYVIEERYDVLFGTASFFGADVARHAEALSLLHHRHLAPEALRARALPQHFQRMDLVPEAEIDRRRAMLAIPPLIKAYLRLGGTVGEGAYVDRAFNTVDVLLILDTAQISPRQRALYTQEALA